MTEPAFGCGNGGRGPVGCGDICIPTSEHHRQIHHNSSDNGAVYGGKDADMSMGRTYMVGAGGFRYRGRNGGGSGGRGEGVEGRGGSGKRDRIMMHMGKMDGS